MFFLMQEYTCFCLGIIRHQYLCSNMGMSILSHPPVFSVFISVPWPTLLSKKTWALHCVMVLCVCMCAHFQGAHLLYMRECILWTLCLYLGAFLLQLSILWRCCRKLILYCLWCQFVIDWCWVVSVFTFLGSSFLCMLLGQMCKVWRFKHSFFVMERGSARQSSLKG